MDDLTADQLAKLNQLAVDRARHIERIQEIDDQAAELVGPVWDQLQLEVRQAVDSRDQLESTWAHVMPKRTHPLV